MNVIKTLNLEVFFLAKFKNVELTLLSFVKKKLQLYHEKCDTDKHHMETQ